MKHALHRQRKMQRLSLYGALLAFMVQLVAWSTMPVAAATTGSAGAWMVICTSDGFKRIPLSEAGIQPYSLSADSAAVLVDHCDLCVFAQGLGMGPAPVQLHGEVSSVQVLRLPISKDIIFRGWHAPQQPRAPPVDILT